MLRIPEPELMDDRAQAGAYDRADFAEAHEAILDHFGQVFGDVMTPGPVVDLGCGTADITVRFARRFAMCEIHGVDGAEAMLVHASRRVGREGLEHRVRLIHRALPWTTAPVSGYRTIISNSLLHHLHDPDVLWRSIRAIGLPGARVFVADLMRPESESAARALVQAHAADESERLRADLFNSLRAAFTPSEVVLQLREAGLAALRVKRISDRHLLVHGQL